jgi:lysozyme family protein
MANFEEAIAFTLRPDIEGGYANNPRDHGAETFKGISRRWFPNWAGWARVDELKAAGASVATINHDTELNSHVPEFYRANFWNSLYDRINSQAIANKLFDLGVNMSTATAIKLLQTACIDCAMPVAADGKFGSVTLNAVNSLDPVLLLTAFKKRALGHYQHIVAMDATQSVFIDGWAKRAMA